MSKKKTVELENSDIVQTNDELKNVEQIGDSVFNCVRVEDKYFLALGKYRLSELTEDKQVVIDSIHDTTWERLMSIMHIVATEAYIEFKSKEDAEVKK